jgi:DNA polymerase III epsilon subunit-like protein
MKYLSDYKNFENISYGSDWKKPDSPIRTELVNDLEDILIDLIDLGYRPNIGGFINSRKPFVWISNNKYKNRKPIDWEEVRPFIGRIKKYLKLKGFEVSENIVNPGGRMEQIFINFDKEDEKKNENKDNDDLFEDLSDILIEIEDLGYKYNVNKVDKFTYYIWATYSDFNEIKPFIDRAKRYLRTEGYEIVDIQMLDSDSLKSMIYLYFKKNNSINENKMWYKTIPQMLDWIKSKSDIPWLMIDTETTGLGGPKVQQLTQVSAIAMNYDFNSNTFQEISQFDEKIKLTDETKSKYNNPGDKTKWVLGFNHYGSGNYKYKLESDVLNHFFNWIDNYTPCLLVAQNAQFDMSMLAVRGGRKITNEVFDTKMLIQLYFLPLIQKLAETDKKYQEMVNFIGTSERDNSLISSSMSKIGPVLGVNMSGYHDALTDCRLMCEMFQGMVDLLKEHQSIDISKYQLERIKVIR